MATAKAQIKKAGLFYFVFLMFSYTTGGPFGMEEMVTTSGPGLTLLYILLIPLFWSVPVSLVTAEPTTAIPVEGGFYRWVRAGYGDFWVFLAGWWNWSASWLLGGSYAVLFSDYLTMWFPSLIGWKHYLVSLGADFVSCVHQNSRNSAGRDVQPSLNFRADPGASVVRHCGWTVAS